VFTLGGTGGGIAYNRAEFDICRVGLAASHTQQVLEKSLPACEAFPPFLSALLLFVPFFRRVGKIGFFSEFF
jgi:hypothetical protein